MAIRGTTKYHAVQKIGKNGTSAVLTMTRALMFNMRILPGDHVEVWIDEDGVGHFRPWQSMNALDGKGPGQLHDKPVVDAR